MKKVRIVSEDGTTRKIKFFDTETNTEIRGINYLQIGPVTHKDGVITATIGLILPRIDIQALASFFIDDPRWFELNERLELAGYEIVKKEG